MSKRRSQGPPPRNVMTPRGPVKYADSGWTPEQWATIRAAMARARVPAERLVVSRSGNQMRLDSS